MPSTSWNPELSIPLDCLAESEKVLAKLHGHSPTSLPVQHPTSSFWTDSPGANPLATEGSTGPLTEDADICIIGSGITGISAAYHLAKAFADANRPLKITILEARDFCSGATGRNGGHLTPAIFSSFKRAQESYGTEEALRGFALETYTAKKMLDIIGEHQLDVDLVQGGHITLCLSSADFEKNRDDFNAAKSAGIDVSDVKWFDKNKMKKLFGTPFPAVAIGGHNLWPLKFVTQLYTLARAMSPLVSTNIHTRTPVTSISPLSPSSIRRWELETARGSIHCTHVIHATNAYVSHLLPQMAGPGGVIPTRGQIIALRANATTEIVQKTSWEANEGFEYWFPRPVSSPDENPLIILGGGRETSGATYELYETNDATLNPTVSKTLKNFLVGIFEGIYEKDREPEMEWTGIMGYTTMGDPFVGPVFDESGEKVKGQFVAAGYTGHGMPRAFACAEIIAGMIAAEIQCKEWVSPKWLPNRYLTWARDPVSGLVRQRRELLVTK
ncbi:FAD dependent oxidoreductase-domain-containing protein [Mycena floridula]|nr:FAD dependent oxidoreductase-domain-containing protein [Mycena floridula]